MTLRAHEGRCHVCGRGPTVEPEAFGKAASDFINGVADVKDKEIARLKQENAIYKTALEEYAAGASNFARAVGAIDEVEVIHSCKKYGPDNPPRLRKPGETLEEYRAAMGWSK